jgi:hypothetical protein
MTGSCRMGKFTEFAMKHLACACLCRLVAVWIISADATVTAGRSMASVKCPPPSSVSVIVASASSR